ncbi:MAG: guanylate kinase [Acidimicrobiales bacterium]
MTPADDQDDVAPGSLTLAVTARAGWFVLSGPTGAGKTTLVRSWLAAEPDLVYARTVTTRSPRPGSEEFYDFVSPERFDDLVHSGEFLQWAAPAPERRYGTLREPVVAALAKGDDVIVDYSPEMYLNARLQLPEAVVGIFVAPSSLDELARRVRERGSESTADANRRWALVRRDMALALEHHYYLINDDLERAVQTVRAIRAAERARMANLDRSAPAFQLFGRPPVVRYAEGP